MRQALSFCRIVRELWMLLCAESETRRDEVKKGSKEERFGRGFSII